MPGPPLACLSDVVVQVKDGGDDGSCGSSRRCACSCALFPTDSGTLSLESLGNTLFEAQF